MKQLATVAVALMGVLLAWTMAVLVGAPLAALVLGEILLAGLVVTAGILLARYQRAEELAEQNREAFMNTHKPNAPPASLPRASMVPGPARESSPVPRPQESQS